MESTNLPRRSGSRPSQSASTDRRPRRTGHRRVHSSGRLPVRDHEDTESAATEMEEHQDECAKMAFRLPEQPSAARERGL